MSKDMLIALDQGTTSTRAIVYDAANLTPLFASQHEFAQHYPRDGWVEHDVGDIWKDAKRVLGDATGYASGNGGKVRALGITNQRETVVLWEKEGGKPLGRAIVWQDRRTAPRCEELKKMGLEEKIRGKTGLVVDPYFSATKLSWLLNETESLEKAKRGEVLAGTIDAFLVWRLTGGKRFATDVTNASRTQLFSLADMGWDEELLELHNVPLACLPKVQDCSGDFGEADLGEAGKVPILGVAGDQQAAAIGQACLGPGDGKSTYGTGCFMIVQGASDPIVPEGGLLGTVGYKVGDRTSYAVEGSIFVAGAIMRWLRDKVGLLDDAAASEKMSADAARDDGTYFVPAFTGLGAPYWNPDARGAVLGMSLDTGRNDIVRAALSSIAFSTHDLVESFASQRVRPSMINIDGGMSRNDWFAQRLSDMTSLEITRPRDTETTAAGAAYLAGLGAGMYSSLDDIAELRDIDRAFSPSMAEEQRRGLLSGWHSAIDAALSHARNAV